jgi:GAF domain-containing protein
LNAVCDHFEHHAAALFLLNDERTHLFIAADRGLGDEEREIQLFAEDPTIAALMSDGKPALIESQYRSGAGVLSISERTKSSLVAPIRGHTEPLGLLILSSTQSGVYTASDLELLGAVAAQSGIAISNAWLYEEATRQTEEAGALYELSQHVNATLHLDRVLQFVADSVVGVLKVDKFALMLLDPDAHRLVTKVSRGVDEERFESIRTAPGQGIAGWVFEWMTPTAVADVRADARNTSAPIQGEDIVSAICVPLAVGDDVIGVMMGMSSRRRFFTVAEMELMYTIANQAAVAIANATLYRDARSKSAEMHRYFRGVAKALGSALEARDLPQLLADLAVEVMRADRCAIYRTEGETVHVHATSHFKSSGTPDPEIPIGEGLTGWVAKRGKALAIEALMGDSRTQAHGWLTKEKLASYLAVPLKIGRKTVGVIEIFTQDARSFNDDEIKLLSQFARRARVAERLVVQA